jgi:hypothetical protein
VAIRPHGHDGLIALKEDNGSADAEDSVVGDSIHLSRFHGHNGVGAPRRIDEHRIGATALLPLLRLLNIILWRVGARIAGDMRHTLSCGQKVELVNRLKRGGSCKSGDLHRGMGL